MNLLRSTSSTGDGADIGEHQFIYSLYPHEGDYIKGGVVRAGYELNIPLIIVPITTREKVEDILSKSFITLDKENIIVETVKKAEDSDDIIVRLYECHGAKTTVKLAFCFDFKTIRLVDMMEEVIDGEDLNKNSLELIFKPFEIYTLKVSI